MVKSLILLVTILILASCSTNKILRSDTPPPGINSVDFFESMANIGLITEKNKIEYNDSMSLEVASLVDTLLLENNNLFRIRKKLIISDDSIAMAISGEIIETMNHIIVAKDIKEITLPPSIDSYMDDNQLQYTLGILTTGFSRRKGNYGKEIAKGIGVGLLTLGMYTPVPYKANTAMYFVIFDNHNNSVKFYRQSKPVEKSPLDKSTLYDSMYKVFEGYYY